uniref:Uncharacterized protein n=1 Tax=Anguilla anguilla TaxID=7936 RepID=A0A0E9PZU6_ANGAN
MKHGVYLSLESVKMSFVFWKYRPVIPVMNVKMVCSHFRLFHIRLNKPLFFTCIEGDRFNNTLVMVVHPLPLPNLPLTQI